MGSWESRVTRENPKLVGFQCSPFLTKDLSESSDPNFLATGCSWSREISDNPITVFHETKTMKIINHIKTALGAFGLAAVVATTSYAQPPEGRSKGGKHDGGPGEREGTMRGGEGGMRGGDPAMVARMMMQRFDKDGDQKLNSDELLAALGAMRQMVGPGGPGSFGGGPGTGGPGGFGGGPGAGGPQMMGRMFEQSDANGDGKLSGDEIPERMRQGMARIDTNGDGAIEKSEIEQMMRSFGGSNRPGGPGGEGGEGNRTPKRPPAEE